MARNVSLAEDVYLALKRIKREGESFSEVIRRLLESRPAIAEVAGKHLLSEESWEKARERIEAMQRISAERIRHDAP